MSLFVVGKGEEKKGIARRMFVDRGLQEVVPPFFVGEREFSAGNVWARMSAIASLTLWRCAF